MKTFTKSEAKSHIRAARTLPSISDVRGVEQVLKQLSGINSSLARLKRTVSKDVDTVQKASRQLGQLAAGGDAQFNELIRMRTVLRKVQTNASLLLKNDSKSPEGRAKRKEAKVLARALEGSIKQHFKVTIFIDDLHNKALRSRPLSTAEVKVVETLIAAGVRLRQSLNAVLSELGESEAAVRDIDSRLKRFSTARLGELLAAKGTKNALVKLVEARAAVSNTKVVIKDLRFKAKLMLKEVASLIDTANAPRTRVIIDILGRHYYAWAAGRLVLAAIAGFLSAIGLGPLALIVSIPGMIIHWLVLLKGAASTIDRILGTHINFRIPTLA